MSLWILGIMALVVIAFLAAGTGFAMFSRNVGAKVEEALPPAGRKTAVAGGEIHFVEAGEGQPIVMIHGLAGNLHNFTYAMTGALAKDYRVIALDRPGCGYSTRENDDRARLPQQAAMVAEFLEREGIENPLVVGHSLGGALSLFLALNHPERVGGLAMIAPLTAVQDDAPGAFDSLNIANPGVRRLVAGTLAVPMTIRNGDKALGEVFGPEAAPEDFRTRGGSLLSLRPEAFYVAATDLHAVPPEMRQVQARYSELQHPLGMLYGDGDRILHWKTHIAPIQAARPDLDLEVLEGVGHMPPITQPERTEAFIRRMAERVFAAK
ncbi:alpha/beta hydrolase [Maricaulis sp.]|uniref:alpha/beta fold hydrolase n=1 Tax=Maricaulis sp. TaxID=1486257 RepID=UPI00261457FE|nr:alpha/beta hydrolase [Maricaulis sp.]